MTEYGDFSRIAAKVKRCLVAVLPLVFLASCNPKDAPLQSDAKPLGFARYAPVKASGSDLSSWWFELETLPSLIALANKEYSAAAVADHFDRLKLDPARLKLSEETDVRVYFIGEGSGYRDALGINLEGVGLLEGHPRIIFPNANTNVQLDACAALINPRRMRLSRSKLGERSQINPLLPGDFVDLGRLPAGTNLNFFLIADEGDPEKARTYTAVPEKNPDGIAHMVAMAVEKTAWLVLSFEDMYQGGDKDYEDCVFAVELSAGNIETLIGKIDPWRRVKQMAMLGATLAILIGGPATVLVLKRRARKRRLDRARAQAEALLESSHPEDALKILDTIHAERLDRRSRDIWRGIELAVYERTKDVEGLRDLFGRTPKLFERHESAALSVGRAEVDDDHVEVYTTLRNAWRDREQMPAEWLALDVDLLVRQDKALDAMDLLTTNRFKGTADAGRIARYAVLKATEDVPRAGAMLAEALALDPRNPEVHVCRGQYLELQGNVKDAVTAYRTALGYASTDPRIADLLAEALRRTGEQEEALRIWTGFLDPPSMSYVWLKTLFWTRVSIPMAVAWDGRRPPRGSLRPLIDFILQLDRGRFWDAREFGPIAERQPELLSRQETFWLRVLEALRTGQDAEALSLLNLQGFGVRSWNPFLENALLRIVIYRLRGFLGTPSTQDPGMTLLPKPNHPFFSELDDWTQHAGIRVPEHAGKVLQSNYVFAAACFAVGWWEAGLALLRSDRAPDDAPAWFRGDFEEAKRRHARVFRTGS